MSFRLNIDSASEAPIYRQISEQIAGLIKNGRLVEGEHLPPERELALRLRVARGTVKKAYEALVHQGCVVAARGRGSVVAACEFPDSAGRLERAEQKIFETITALEDLKFSHREITGLFSSILARREEEIAGFAIAAVDCNPEALGIYQKQLAMLTRMSTARILLSDLREASSADVVLAPFDLILTTANHFEELQKLAPVVAHKIVQVIVAPTQATLIDLARLEKTNVVGVVYQSGRFLEIIMGWLKKSGFHAQIQGFDVVRGSSEKLGEFVADKNVLILPPGYAAQLPSDYLGLINRFRLDGGQLIDFDYQIERGSLLYLEELIKSSLNKPGK
ncbi:MAG: GntR family transcriptional regulator [Erysipelotrichia bacterium]|nr:GntR family transcriptional regulator [Erysipelotrichia bacterium]